MKMPIQQANPDVGFQIAPMIDVVFVILVFFMALAAQIKIEQILQTKLPGVAIASATTEFVDEQILSVGEDGAMMAVRTGAALAVARKGRTRMADFTDMVQGLMNAGVAVVGSVLNEVPLEKGRKESA